MFSGSCWPQTESLGPEIHSFQKHVHQLSLLPCLHGEWGTTALQRWPWFRPGASAQLLVPEAPDLRSVQCAFPAMLLRRLPVRVQCQTCWVQIPDPLSTNPSHLTLLRFSFLSQDALLVWLAGSNYLFQASHFLHWGLSLEMHFLSFGSKTGRAEPVDEASVTFIVRPESNHFSPCFGPSHQYIPHLGNCNSL